MIILDGKIANRTDEITEEEWLEINKTNRDMELDLANKISQMLHAYSPSIDNEKKGRNLLHKLLLEKRLIIEELPNNV